MFREMRRKKQLLPIDAAENMLRQGITGVLGVIGDDGYPYTVPLNYVYQDGAIYFHCARAGHKLDAIRRNEKVSFCTVGQEKIIPEQFTAHFQSVIAFGCAFEITDDGEKRRIMRLLNQKYAPGLDEAGDKEIQREWSRLTVVQIRVEHLTGKEAIELVNAKQKK